MSEASLVLVGFAWRDAGAAARLRAAAGNRGTARLFRAIDGHEACAYVAPGPALDARALLAAIRVALPDAQLSLLEQLKGIAGASAAEDARWRYVVETDVLAEREADFNAWYDAEHLAGLAAVQGCVRAMRFRRVEGAPRYQACYDLARREAFGSPEWLAVRATPWSARVRPAFLNTRRTMFARVV
jgi:hypothetical protein